MNAKILLVFFTLIVLAAFPAAADEYAAISEKLKLCAGCHGEKGASSNPEYPILAGQHLYYLYVQLKDFKSGFRKNDIMSPLASDLEKAEMLSLAKYFSEQKWPGIGFRADPDKAAKGEMAAVAGQCVQCHLGGYEGNSRIPRLAGQYPKYLKTINGSGDVCMWETALLQSKCRIRSGILDWTEFILRFRWLGG